MEIGVGFLSVIEPITLCIIQRKFLNSAFGKKKLAQCSLEVEKNYSYFFKSKCVTQTGSDSPLLKNKCH
jgi:hypothetical protein